MEECVFCDIVNKKVEAPIQYEDEKFVVIPSKYPAADTHLLVIMKKHISTIAHAEEDDQEDLGAMLLLAAKVAREQNLPDYKLVINSGKYPQIHHLHIHVLAGDNLEDNT